MQCGQYKLTPQSFMPTIAATFVLTITLAKLMITKK